MSCRMPKYCLWSILGGGWQLRVIFLPSIEPPSHLGNLTLEARLNFRGCLDYFWLYWDGLAHGRIWTLSLNSTAQREPSLRWDLDGIRLCCDGDSACTHARTPRTCRRAIHFWQVVLPKQTDAIDLSQHREKIGFRKGRNHIHGMFKLTLTMWVCRQE